MPAPTSPDPVLEVSLDAVAPREERRTRRRAPSSFRSAARNHVKVGLHRSYGQRVELAVAMAVLVVVIITNLLSLELDHLRTTVINANWEYSWSHDVDALALAVGTCAAATGWRREPGRRSLWAATGAILVLLFLDEVSPLHAEIGAVSGGKLLYLPILAALVACLWSLSAGTRERALVSWGVLTLLLSFVLHTPGLHILRQLGYTDWIYQSGVGLKEGAELAGLILVVAALLRLSRRTDKPA